MSEGQVEAKVSYPYMGNQQWYGVRAKLRQSVPKTVDVDWLMAALGTSEKGARNVLPQLKAIGIIDAAGKPTDLALDLRDDNHYAAACSRVLESLYPQGLRDAYDDPDADVAQVAGWFMRNARTGQGAATMQARLYLTLLKGELPGEEEKPRTPRKRTAKKAAEKPSTRADEAHASPVTTDASVDGAPHKKSGAAHSSTPPHSTSVIPAQTLGPALHIDLQIHIAADATDSQIDAVFKSMAKHLYGRE